MLSPSDAWITGTIRRFTVSPDYRADRPISLVEDICRYALTKDIDLATSNLSPDELAGLLAIDGSITQRRPSMEIEIRLRQLGLIERNGMSRLPTRTKRGNDVVNEAGLLPPEK